MLRGLRQGLLIAVAAAFVAPACAQADPLVAAAGDIACPPGAVVDAAHCQQGATATEIQGNAPAAVLALGDDQYNSGSLAEFNGSFDNTWGVFKPLIYPVAGNHEYGDPNSPAPVTQAEGYYLYFSSFYSGRTPEASNPSKGYYSYELGSWHMIALNSNCSDSGCSKSGPGRVTTAEVAWLQADLAAHPGVCTLAYWHHPVFSSDGRDPGTAQLWDQLRAANADLVLNGHAHNYERFAAQNSAGTLTPGAPREVVVGTGGEDLFGAAASANSQFFDNAHFGALFLSLHPAGYDLNYKTIDGVVRDTASFGCNRDATTTTASATPDPARPSDPLVLDAHVQDSTTPATTPTGSVAFTIDGSPAGGGPVPVDSTGHAQVTAPPRAPGTYQLRAAYAGSNAALKSASAPTTIRVTPAAPSGVSATGGDGQATITWNAATGASSYKIFRGTSPNVPGASPLATTSATSFTDSSAANGTTYYYSVVAAGSGGDSPRSQEAAATPTAVTSTALSSTPEPSIAGEDVTLHATVVEDNAAATKPTGTVTFSVAGNTVGSAPVSDGQATFTVHGLRAGTYALSATYGGSGSARPSTSPGGTQHVRPAAPDGVTATPGNTAATVGWNASDGASAYDLVRDGIVVASTSATSFADSGLANGVTYTYHVVARGAGGNSPGSVPATVTPQAPQPLPVPPVLIPVFNSTLKQAPCAGLRGSTRLRCDARQVKAKALVACGKLARSKRSVCARRVEARYRRTLGLIACAPRSASRRAACRRTVQRAYRRALAAALRAA